MKACVLYAPHDIRVEKHPLPQPAPGYVRLKMGAVGICGSDLHYYHHGRVGNAVVREPLILGHELSGIVDAVGADVHQLDVGQHVVVNPTDECGVCLACREGKQHLCPALRYYGSAARMPHVQGVLCEFPLVQARQCLVIDPAVAMEHAACVEPLAIALHAVKRAGNIFGKRVFISGAGPVGCLVVAAARLHGAQKVAISDLEAFPLILAQSLGAQEIYRVDELGPDMFNTFDVCIEASGAVAGLHSCLQQVAPGGTVVQVGFMPQEEVLCPVNTMLIRKEVSLCGSLRAYQEFPHAVQLLESCAINLSTFVTASYPLAMIQEAFATASDKTRAMKVIITPDP